MRPEVERIEGNPRIRNVEPVKVTEQELNAATNESISAATSIEPGVSLSY
jgi:hypothetical protein